VFVQGFGHGLGRLVLLPHPDPEGLEAAMEEEAGLWVQHPTEELQGVSHLIYVLGRPGHDARGEVGVPAKVFGTGVENHVEAEVGGTHVDRRGERAVDHGDQPMGLREVGHRLQIRHAEEGVGDRFRVEHVRIRGQGVFPVRRSLSGKKRTVDIEPGQ